MKPHPQQTQLVGKWIMVDNQARADAACEQIQWLTTHHFKKIATSKEAGGWETLFQDPDDERYWELTYPQSYMHGGGPPQLCVLGLEQAHGKYGSLS